MIRSAEFLDISDIIVLDSIGSDPKRQRRINEAVNSGECYVFTESSQIVGYGIFHHNFYGCGFIELVVVSPDYRRRGIASSLVRRFESLSKTSKVFTSTNQSNFPMQKLLGKLGYRPSGFIENLDTEDPELVYFREIVG